MSPDKDPVSPDANQIVVEAPPVISTEAEVSAATVASPTEVTESVVQATDIAPAPQPLVTAPQSIPMGLLKALQRQKASKHALGWTPSPFAAERRKKKRKAVKAARKVNRK